MIRLGPNPWLGCQPGTGSTPKNLAEKVADRCPIGSPTLVGGSSLSLGVAVSRCIHLILSTIIGFTYAVPVWADKPEDKPQPKFEIRKAETKPAEGLTEAAVGDGTKKVYIHKSAELTGTDIAEASVTREKNTEKLQIEITFTKEGGKKMQTLTENHKDKPIAILVAGKIVAAPEVKVAISTKAMITGTFSREEADAIVRAITSK